MMEGIKKMFLAGLGAMSLSREKAKVIVDELVAQGKIKEKEGKKLMKEMAERAEKLRQDAQKAIHSQMSTAYTRVNLATQEQLKRMEQRLHHLESQLAKSRRPAGTPLKKGSSRPARRRAK